MSGGCAHQAPAQPHPPPQAALRGDPEALRVVQVEQQLVTIVSLFAEAFSTSSGSYTTVGRQWQRGVVGACCIACFALRPSPCSRSCLCMPPSLPACPPAAAALAFKGIQQAIRAYTTSQRRLLAASMDLTSGATVTGLMSSTLTLAQATIPTDYYRATLSPHVLQVGGVRVGFGG